MVGIFCIFGIFTFQNKKILMELAFPHLPSFEESASMGLAVITEEIISRYYIQGVSLKAFNPVYSIFFLRFSFLFYIFLRRVHNICIFSLCLTWNNLWIYLL